MFRNEPADRTQLFAYLARDCAAFLGIDPFIHLVEQITQVKVEARSNEYYN